MTRKSRNTPRRIGISLFILLAGVVVTLAATGFSSAALKTSNQSLLATVLGQSKGRLDLRAVDEDGNPTHVIITADDIRNLPPGENRIMQKIGGGNIEGGAGAKVVKSGQGDVILSNANNNTSVNLTKTGTGTLILPQANNTGVTKVGPGVLRNSDNNNAAMKELLGTLILSGRSSAVADELLTLNGIGVGIVYEFRNLGSLEFGRVVVPATDLPTEEVSFPFGTVLTVVQQQRPAGAMKGWPFSRLLFGPAKGIAQVEGWKPRANDRTASSKYVCPGGFCKCSGTADCLALANSGSCSSDMNCDGAGNSINCYCRAK